MFRGCIKLNYSAVLKAHQLYLFQPAYTGVIRETRQESSSQNVSDRWCQFWQSRWFGVHTNRAQTGCHLVQGVEAESHWCTWELLWSWRVNICTVDSVATYVSALLTMLQHMYLHCGQCCNIRSMAAPVPTLCSPLHCAAIAQAVSYKGLSSEPGQQDSPCDIHTGRTGTGTGFCYRTSVLSC